MWFLVGETDEPLSTRQQQQGDAGNQIGRSPLCLFTEGSSHPLLHPVSLPFWCVASSSLWKETESTYHRDADTYIVVDLSTIHNGWGYRHNQSVHQQRNVWYRCTMWFFFLAIQIFIWRTLNVAGDGHITWIVNLRKTNVACSSHLAIHKILYLQMTRSEAV